MINDVPANVYRRESEILLRRLRLAKGFVRQDGETWSVLSRGNGYRRPVDTAQAWLVEAMRTRGVLVARSGGGLMPLAAQGDASGRLGDYRPPRPEGEAAVAGINVAESPLTWLRARKLIGTEQYLAGEKLRADYERSRLERRITASWQMPTAAPGSTRGNAEISDHAIAARQKLQRALDSVGPELSAILVHVCCLASGLEQAERLLELPQRSGKALLGVALTGLARHYGLLRTQSRAQSAIAHWAAEDYRPAIASPAEG